MFRWSRALELAVKHKTHIETVIGYRQKYLDQIGKKETDPKFLKHMGEVEIDWNHIRETIAEEKIKEEKK
uniref:Transposase n=1 Tax=Heterorhabditis bacteriophora TaxID=37862 RepID=A0A1I7XJL4_HETBA